MSAWSRSLVGLFALVLLPALARADVDASAESRARIEARIDSIWEQVDAIEAGRQENWLTRERAEDVRAVVTGVLEDADTRSSLQGTVANLGYDNGYYVRASDDSFEMRFRGQVQFRWMYDHRSTMPGQQDGQSATYGFEIRRMKLHFFGHVVDPSLTYRLTLATNMASQASGPEGAVFMENMWVQKRFENGLRFRVGQYKGPYLREEIVPSVFLLTVDRSMVNHAFTYGWTEGLEIGWDGDGVHLVVMYNDGPRQQNVGAYQSGMQSILARANIVLAGEYAQFTSLTNQNAEHFGLMLGAAFQWFQQSGPEGGFSYGNVHAQDSLGFTVDLSMFDRGWTAFTYFVWANGRDTAGGFDQPSVDSWGWVGQGGITVLEDLQLFGRYELGDIQDYRGSLTRPGETGHLSTLTVGFNWWPIGIQDIKVACDFGYSFSSIDGGNGANQSPGNGNTNPGSARWPGVGNGWQPDYGNQNGQWVVRAQFQIEF
ncbi:MAG: OprO/OprP family phosphate-selective porin [Phycisphaerales bacterium]|nr:OprO/OprP family phosphate-selective porin [Phycisphaerales bacterium]